MSEGCKRAREIAAFAAVIPSCGAVSEDNTPLNFPIGVRAAERMTASYPRMSEIIPKEYGKLHLCLRLLHSSACGV